VFARGLSAAKPDRLEASHVLHGPASDAAAVPDKATFIAAVRSALYASKIVSYAQGYMLMRDASNQNNWNLDYGKIALMWRGGCIIRSKFLVDIHAAFERKPDLSNLLLDQFFTDAVHSAQSNWRFVVSQAALHGVPCPTFMTALAYYDAIRSASLPANLLQAQRDYFGAHTYERVDQPAGQWFHTNWTGTGGTTTAASYNA
jgi:6-phosphogluconate dehydrogenase